MTDAEMLVEVQSAISAIMTGAQSYTHQGRSLTRANLADLQAREIRLMQRISKTTRGGIKMSGVSPVDI